jgi:hypothetical protein
MTKDIRDSFEDWAERDYRRLEAEEFEERTPDNNHFYADDTTNQAYIGWCAALASLSTAGYVIVKREDVRQKIEPWTKCAACGGPDETGCYPKCMSAARPGWSPVPCQPIHASLKEQS